MFISIEVKQLECLERNESDCEMHWTFSFWVNDTVHYVEVLKKQEDDSWQHNGFLTLDEEDGFIPSNFSSLEEEEIFQTIQSFADSHAIIFV